MLGVKVAVPAKDTSAFEYESGATPVVFEPLQKDDVGPKPQLVTLGGRQILADEIASYQVETRNDYDRRDLLVVGACFLAANLAVGVSVGASLGTLLMMSAFVMMVLALAAPFEDFTQKIQADQKIQLQLRSGETVEGSVPRSGDANALLNQLREHFDQAEPVTR